MSVETANPYSGLGPNSFWRSGVANVGPFGLTELWTPKFRIVPKDRIVTAGSCFAQHIGRAMADRGYHWVDAEPAPPFLRAEDARRFNYGIFSFRTGNIYTPRMLLQWLELTFASRDLPDEIWQEGGRFFDPLRPVIEPEGFASLAELQAARSSTLASLRKAVTTANVFVFTLGLTESWVNTKTGLEYALCPGTVPGCRFDPEKHVFRNSGFRPLMRDMQAAIKLMRAHNPGLKILLTVSPVPLTATASRRHVLTATTLSKSVLRAVAGQLEAEMKFVDYFPSYEIITHPVFRGMFYAPNMRSVEAQGVATVMQHFFADQARVFGPVKKRQKRKPAAAVAGFNEVKCEEELLGDLSS
ncbi:MAG: GSCFA domain-containing protein [Paracoccaceae bacterium]|uniref:GSCFA domain-containing protein n=1 Tax=Seohaeicola saemankumensis TaxID=481181 RepID=UPI001E4A5BF6|nr:GSCFA domain-containing protein [Seohaeicola saemankumensis]MCD1628155.1 GSCFA domain-containing protein [Seohaeicola saemankumensis]